MHMIESSLAEYIIACYGEDIDCNIFLRDVIYLLFRCPDDRLGIIMRHHPSSKVHLKSIAREDLSIVMKYNNRTTRSMSRAKKQIVNFMKYGFIKGDPYKVFCMLHLVEKINIV